MSRFEYEGVISFCVVEVVSTEALCDKLRTVVKDEVKVHMISGLHLRWVLKTLLMSRRV